MEYINHWQWIDLFETKSTNDEAKKYGSQVIVSAKRQTFGRGRRGRTWIGIEGNLFVSFNISFEPRLLGRMIIRIGLAVFETVKFFANNADVKLKWPNDVLVNGKKICGILVEKNIDDLWTVGIGVNITQAPDIEGLIYPATSFKDIGVETDRIDFLKKMMSIFDDVAKRDFDEIKRTWLMNVKDIGSTIKVKGEDFEIDGKFVGIDNDGILMLECNGEVKKIFAGDVSY